MKLMRRSRLLIMNLYFRYFLKNVLHWSNFQQSAVHYTNTMHEYWTSILSLRCNQTAEIHVGCSQSRYHEHSIRVCWFTGKLYHQESRLFTYSLHVYIIYVPYIIYHDLIWIELQLGYLTREQKHLSFCVNKRADENSCWDQLASKPHS